MKRILKIGAATLILLIVSLILVRLADFGFLYWMRHTLYYYAMPPGDEADFNSPEFQVTYKLSSIGLNNPEVSLPKPKDTIRILALGDSTTFGWGVTQQQGWTKQLEKNLNDSGQLPFKVEIINSGVPGTSPENYPKICNFYYNQLDIDYALIAFYSNDIYEVGSMEKEQESFLSLISQTLIPNISSLKKGRAQSRTMPTGSVQNDWKALAEDIVNRNGLEALSKLDPQVRKEFLTGNISPTLVNIGLLDPKYYQAPEIPEYANVALPKIKQYITQTISNCGGPSHLLGFTYIPADVLISKDFQEPQKKLGLDIPNWLLASHVSEDYYKESTQNLAPYVSFVDNFRSDGCPDCYFPYDTHLTKSGNQRLADGLKDTIISRLKTLNANK